MAAERLRNASHSVRGAEGAGITRVRYSCAAISVVGANGSTGGFLTVMAGPAPLDHQDRHGARPDAETAPRSDPARPTVAHTREPPAGRTAPSPRVRPGTAQA